MKNGTSSLGLMSDLADQASSHAVCPTPRCSWAHWFAAKTSLAADSTVIWKANRAASFHSKAS